MSTPIGQGRYSRQSFGSHTGNDELGTAKASDIVVRSVEETRLMIAALRAKHLPKKDASPASPISAYKHIADPTNNT